MTPDVVTAGGATIPRIGLGTYQLRGRTALRCVEAAIKAGYRHIDTAAMYDNEEAVGEGIRGSGIARSEIFVTTKVWRTDLREADFLRSAEASVKRLGVGAVDLLLIHWPNPDVPLEETIGALCKAKRRGLTRHIGVSNFPVALLKQALSLADEPIVTDQVEHHPYLEQRPLFDFCRGEDIAVTSYSPLSRGSLLREEAIAAVARDKGRTPAQVVLRWHLQQPGNIAIPRSAEPRRIAENLDAFGFELSPQEMERISGLARPGA